MVQTRLKQLREEAVLTVHELAEASGVSDDTISKIENGQRVARPNTLRKLSHALNVRPQELRRPAKVEEPVPLAEAPKWGRPSVIDVALDAARRQIALEEHAEEEQTEPQDMLDQRHANEAMRRLREVYGLGGNEAEELVDLMLKYVRLEKENATLRDRLQGREQVHS